MQNKYSNFVKPCFSNDCKEPSLTRTVLNGDEARNIYLKEITSTPDADIKESVKKKCNLEAGVPQSCSDRQLNNIEFLDKDLFTSVQNGNIETLKLILEKCPDKVNILDDYGWSLLMIACQANNIEVAEELLKRGVNTSIQDKAGNSAQSLIIKNKNNKLAALFLNYRYKNRTNEDNYKSEKNKDVKMDNNNFYCNICNINVPMSRNNHLISTVHNINISKSKKLPTNYVIPQSNRGYQMMIKVGWDKEAGLGPDGTGKKYPIKTIPKKDRKGLGHSKKPNEVKEKVESIKFKNRQTMVKDCKINRKMEVNFRRQFY